MDPRHFTAANFKLLVALYSELLLRFGPDARVFWYRANCYKVLGDFAKYSADLKNVHHTDPDALSVYTTLEDSDDFYDPTLVVWIQWKMLCAIGRELDGHRHEVVRPPSLLPMDPFARRTRYEDPPPPSVAAVGAAGPGG